MRDIHEQLEQRSSRAKLKQRLVGGAVLLIVLAIFLPFIFNHSHLGATTAVEQENTADQTQAPVNSAAQAGDSAAAQSEVAASNQTIESDEAAQEIEAAAQTPVAEAQPPTTPSPQATASQQAEPASAPASTGELTASQSEQSTVAQSQAQAQAQAQPQQQPQPQMQAAPPAQQAVIHSSTPPATGRWVVQVGSFADPKHAQRLVNELRHTGLHAYSRQASHVTRVYAGPVKTQQEAQALQTRVKNEFQLSGLILEKRA